MRLFIVRHADPDYPNNTLTPAGHREAAALARRMVSEIRPTHLYTSPMGRARHTMAYTAQLTGLQARELPWIAELSHWRVDQPILGESTPWDLHGHTLRRWSLEQAWDWHQTPPLDRPMFRAEYDEICSRSDALLAEHGYVRDEAVYRVAAPNTDRLVFFCHGGLGLTWLGHLLAIPLPMIWAGFTLPPSSVTTVLFDQREPGIATPRVTRLGDVSHLYAEGLRVSTAGIKANTE